MQVGQGDAMAACTWLMAVLPMGSVREEATACEHWSSDGEGRKRLGEGHRFRWKPQIVLRPPPGLVCSEREYSGWKDSSIHPCGAKAFPIRRRGSRCHGLWLVQGV